MLKENHNMMVWYPEADLYTTPHTYAIKTLHKHQLARPVATETVLVQHPEHNVKI